MILFVLGILGLFCQKKKGILDPDPETGITICGNHKKTEKNKELHVSLSVHQNIIKLNTVLYMYPSATIRTSVSCAAM